MERFADLHIHMLYGVDDGAKTAEEMKQMMDAAYQDGICTICLTPHYHPGYFGDNREKTETVFRELQAYAADKYPDCELFLGNELRYSQGCVDWLNSGACRTLNGTENVLVDFSEFAEKTLITDAVHWLLNAGYCPVIAHAERYRELGRDLREIGRLKDYGAVIQIDAGSLFGEWGRFAKQKSKKMVEAKLADLVCSDAHGITGRIPVLSKAYGFILKRCGADYAEDVFCSFPRKLLGL